MIQRIKNMHYRGWVYGLVLMVAGFTLTNSKGYVGDPLVGIPIALHMVKRAIKIAQPNILNKEGR